MKKLFCLLAVLLFVSPVSASVLRHRVRPGDTLPSLAKYYYGSEKQDVYIISVNHLERGQALRPGRVILIPFVTVHRVRRKETFRDLAAKYLRSSRKAGVLAMLNNMDAEKELKPGTVVRIPFEVYYRVVRGDTLSGIAARYLGDEQDAVLLKKYNRLRSLASIKPGERLAIPLMPERAQHEKEKHHAVKAVKKINPVLYRHDMQEAISLYDGGEYRHSIDGLNRIIIRLGESRILKKDLITIHRYMAYNYIALAENVAAKGEFMAILNLDPKFSLNRRDTSPKILSVFNEVKSKRR